MIRWKEYLNIHNKFFFLTTTKPILMRCFFGKLLVNHRMRAGCQDNHPVIRGLGLSAPCPYLQEGEQGWGWNSSLMGANLINHPCLAKPPKKFLGGASGLMEHQEVLGGGTAREDMGDPCPLPHTLHCMSLLCRCSWVVSFYGKPAV